MPLYNTKFENFGIGTWFYIQKKKINSINDELYKKLSENKIVKQELDKFFNI